MKNGNIFSVLYMVYDPKLKAQVSINYIKLYKQTWRRVMQRYMIRHLFKQRTLSLTFKTF